MIKSTIEEKQLPAKMSLHEKLQISLFSHHVNRASLAQKVDQSVLLSADYLIQHLCGSLYAVLLFAVDKDITRLDQADELIETGLADLVELRNMLVKREQNLDS